MQSIAVGAPTQFLTASKSIKDFLLRLEARSFAGKYGFAFDTRYDSFMAGSAARYIEKRLETTGYADNQSSYISDSQENENSL